MGGGADIRIYCMREEKNKKTENVNGEGESRVFKGNLNTSFCREVNQAQKARNSVAS